MLKDPEENRHGPVLKTYACTARRRSVRTISLSKHCGRLGTWWQRIITLTPADMACRCTCGAGCFCRIPQYITWAPQNINRALQYINRALLARRCVTGKSSRAVCACSDSACNGLLGALGACALRCTASITSSALIRQTATDLLFAVLTLAQCMVIHLPSLPNGARSFGVEGPVDVWFVCFSMFWAVSPVLFLFSLPFFFLIFHLGDREEGWGRLPRNAVLPETCLMQRSLCKRNF
jgi:hypothetical protein